MAKLKSYLSNQYIVLTIFCLAAIAVSVHLYLISPEILFDGKEYTHYNNYQIFERSFHHLIEGSDLYKLYPEEHWDYFKYSPVFALFMAPFAVLPELPGMILWNLFNVLILFLALRHFPRNTPKINTWMMWFVLLEMITALQNCQSNALIAGLIIFAFVMLEKNNILLGTLFIAISVFIKPFGLVAFSLFLLYPQKLKFIGFSTLWMVILATIPMVVVTPSNLIMQYESLAALIQTDYSLSQGYSVMGWLQSWFGFYPQKEAVILAGVVLFLIPFIKIKNYRDFGFRMLILASILIWVVIFNHKAESSTFVIAISGVAIWFFPQKFRIEYLTLLLLAFIFTSLSPTEMFPRNWRSTWVIPYTLKAAPIIFIWIVIIYELIFEKYQLRKTRG